MDFSSKTVNNTKNNKWVQNYSYYINSLNSNFASNINFLLYYIILLIYWTYLIIIIAAEFLLTILHLTYIFIILYFSFIIISAVKRLIAINRIQNKSFCLNNIWVCSMYIYYVYINIQTYSIYLENI